jgi:hypothetical protein
LLGLASDTLDPMTVILSSSVQRAAANVVSEWVKRRRNAGEDVPPEVEEGLADEPVRHRYAEWRIQTGHAELPSTGSTAVGVAAISIDAESVMRDARERIARMLRINIVLAVVLAGILVLGLGGVVVTGIVLNDGVAALVFGGMSVADAFALAFTKPFALISATVVAGQRLEVVHLRLREELERCSEFTDAESRRRCRREVWQDVEAELRSLAK